MILIGDVHGRIKEYLSLLKALALQGEEGTFQLGDIALGFHNVLLPAMDNKHRFIRGNHDSPSICRSHPNYAGEYAAEGDAFWMSGAWSIDQYHRKEGVSWWRDEELTTMQLGWAYDLYCETKPRIVLTHDGPESAVKDIFGFSDNYHRNSTTSALEQMLQAHRPDIWVFGHHHITTQKKIKGTTFHCLGELDTMRV